MCRLFPVILLLVVFLISCKEEEVNKPVFSTLEVIRSNEGATFQGRIAFLHGRYDNYGFVWSENSVPTLQDFVYYFDGKPTEGDFFTEVKNELELNKIYFVRAFLKSGPDIIFSNTVVFESLGSSPPAITGFSPAKGRENDTITISGSNFSTLESNVVVGLGTLRCTVISASREEIKVKIPFFESASSHRFAVNVSGKSVSSSELFVLDGPVIESVSPSSGYALSETVLTGSGFSSNPALNFVKFGNTSATVISASETELLVQIPMNLASGPKDIFVQVGNAKGVEPDGFTVTGPTLTSFSPTVGVQASEVIIKGLGFAPEVWNNMVVFGDRQAEITSASTTELRVKVPEVSYAGQYEVRVGAYGVGSIFAEPFVVEGPEIYDFSPKSAPNGSIVKITGKNFSPLDKVEVAIGMYSELTIVSQSETELEVIIHQQLDSDAPITVSVGTLSTTTAISFDVQYPWRQLGNFDGGERMGPVGFSIGEYGYVGLGTDKKDMWRYDPTDDTWLKLNDFPGVARTGAFSFVINGKAYVGGGFSWTGNVVVRYQDLWEYDPTFDSWTKKNSFPIPDMSLGLSGICYGTSIGSYGYTIMGESLYRYDPALDQWMLSSHGKGSGWSEVQAFSARGKAYFVFYNALHSYDPQTNSWSAIETPKWDYYQLPIGFSMDDNIYFGTAFDMRSFDTATSTWKLFAAPPVLLQYPARFTIGNRAFIVCGTGYSDNFDFVVSLELPL